ncbi:hypothetical protein BU24DRAFT_420390 [Aaosphaeria arxii CBS 175.79]|uniref:Uncharacterized protein n=1 Tax=Aaosphaeria arxii CBS 175.79 TaxID=1450172 RepID=A0A6A5XWL9_9PLEO|nr:uncharacterized protein BU24DRAFT_420390 [Aaosphaeria arxii CBS 175.79]KAF2017346.1 hypothetical protein BU24DRAFT_420390 [Aaosphaeria arxii CBS 175.79]
MPTQHTCFGRPVRLQMPPRRFQFLLGFVLIVAVYLGVSGPTPSAELYEEVAEAVKNPHLPSVPKLEDLPKVPIGPVPNPFGPAAHKPPPSANSTTDSQYRPLQWLPDFKWRNPFSSSVTHDEDIAVLPPLKERPPIYTFYDVRGKQGKEVSVAESRLILAWRRAWWAQGFKPQVLSRDESEKHPLYDLVQRMKLDSKVELEFMKWLAWGHMEGGILANWLALPMAHYDNPMLSFLRRKEYPLLSRVDTLQHGIFFGEGGAVNDVIKKLVNHDLFKNTTATKDKITELGKKPGGPFVNLLSQKEIAVEPKADGIAYYSIDTIAKTYGVVADKLNATTQVEGLTMLATLINSHLHLTFQDIFSEGVAVLKPLPEHSSALMYEAIDIARNLTQCPTSPMPESCPPNRPKCKPCDPEKAKGPALYPAYKNTSTLFTIGTVPHPYTMNLLRYNRDDLDGNFLRRNGERDQWLTATTVESVGETHSSEERVVHFKEAVAAPHNASNSLWLTAERETQIDLDWIFGFNLPQEAAEARGVGHLKDVPGVKTFPRPAQPTPLNEAKKPDDEAIANEEKRLIKARDALKSKDRRMREIIQMVEQWSMADTEAWKFATAWSARRRQERETWEKEEQKYAGSERKAGVRPGGKGLSRWTDKLTG